MQCTSRCKALNRGDLVTLMHHGQRQAGVNAACIHQHGAGTALPAAAGRATELVRLAACGVWSIFTRPVDAYVD